jgi:glycine cleavage system regulatory protein
MKKHALLSATGDDRIGVAVDLTAALSSRGIEIEESRWSALRGRFAMLVEVGGEEKAIARLERELNVLGAKLGFGLQMKRLDSAPAKSRGLPFWIETHSRGPAGVEAVTGVLKAHGVNIEDLETEATTDSWTSRLQFQMKARVSLPPSCPRARLREALRELEADRGVEIAIEPGSALSSRKDVIQH